MLVLLTLPFYDFCGFRSVAVNSVYKLQFFTFINSTIQRIKYGMANHRNKTVKYAKYKIHAYMYI